MITTQRRPIAVADARTGLAHQVTDEAAAVGRRSGYYPAMCGTLVLVASLATPDRGTCRWCVRAGAQ